MKEREKVEKKYMDLTIELQQVLATTTKTIPLIFGALGIISNNNYRHIDMASLLVKDLNVY